MSTSNHKTLPYLQTNILRNIVSLKMLKAFGDVIQSHYTERGPSQGVLLLLPTHAFSYDAQTYPDSDFVVLLSTSDAAACVRLIPQIPRDRKLVFKLLDAQDQKLLAQHFPLQRTRAFFSYTSRPDAQFTPATDVVVSPQVDERCYALYAQQGYSRDEIDGYFARGDAVSCTIYQEEQAVASCFAYLNFEPVWEIGGVYTVPAERRKGYAAQVVQSALHALLSRGQVPRYQVHEANHASIGVAEQLGLVRFATIEHWVYTPTE
jgi:predicted GNAT family acetyltransferase